jgi:hypothetical protein
LEGSRRGFGQERLVVGTGWQGKPSRETNESRSPAICQVPEPEPRGKAGLPERHARANERDTGEGESVACRGWNGSGLGRGRAWLAGEGMGMTAGRCGPELRDGKDDRMEAELPGERRR